MYDYCSIDDDEHKVCSVPPGVLALTYGMLELAIADIVNRNGKDQAVTWIMSNDKEHGLSFLNCCSILQINPMQIRTAVSAYLARNHERKRRKGRKV